MRIATSTLRSFLARTDALSREKSRSGKIEVAGGRAIACVGSGIKGRKGIRKQVRVSVSAPVVRRTWRVAHWRDTQAAAAAVSSAEILVSLRLEKPQSERSMLLFCRFFQPYHRTWLEANVRVYMLMQVCSSLHDSSHLCLD